jgi:hypothetical protein
MIARHGPERRQALKIGALAIGLADKAVSLVYERVLRREPVKSGSSVAKPRSTMCSMCWRKSAGQRHRRSGSAIASATPTSWWPTRCVLPATPPSQC